jgi:hypothetical protein
LCGEASSNNNSLQVKPAAVTNHRTVTKSSQSLELQKRLIHDIFPSRTSYLKKPPAVALLLLKVLTTFFLKREGKKMLQKDSSKDSSPIIKKMQIFDRLCERVFFYP